MNAIKQYCKINDCLVLHKQETNTAVLLGLLRSINTKKGKAGSWQVTLTGCVLGNSVTCQLEKVQGG